MWTWVVSKGSLKAGEEAMLTDNEMKVLAKVGYAGGAGATIGEVSLTDAGLSEAAQSVGRFGLVVGKEPREVRAAGLVCVLSDVGAERLAESRAQRYSCCEHAIRLPCVCSERVYCPNPEHWSGCNGSHD